MFQNQKAYGLIFKLTRVHIFNNKTNTIKEKEEESISWLKGINSQKEIASDNSEHREEKKEEKEEENIIDENIIEIAQSQEKENETEIKNDDDEIFEEVLSIEPAKEKKKKHKKSN